MFKQYFLAVFCVVFQVVLGQSSENGSHTVIDGESLYGIAKKYKTSVSKIIDLNPQVDNGISPGMVLVVPKLNVGESNSKLKDTLSSEIKSPLAEKPAHEVPKDTLAKMVESNIGDSLAYHKVVEGETYYSISRKYQTTVTKLMALNDNRPLKFGENIVVGHKMSSPTVSKVTNGSNIEILEKDTVAARENSNNYKPTVEQQELSGTGKEHKASEVKVVKYEDKTVVSAIPDYKIPVVEPKQYNNAVKKILIIPFDPYLYFSDADMEIAKQSKLEHTKVRQAFRRRLNALLEPQGYETIHLLGGRIKDSLTDLNKIYKNVKYDYQDILYNPEAQVQRTLTVEGQLKESNKNQPVGNEGNGGLGNSRASLAKDESKYYGVKVFDPNFFPYFNNKYEIDYYVFVNQFEIKTNYQTCLDRTTQNYERSLITHFSIYDNTGKRISGNRIKTNYHSNENNLQKILNDNMQGIASQIIGELPKSK